MEAINQRLGCRGNRMNTPLVQGARSTVELLCVDGIECIRKNFHDTKHGSGSVKWAREMAFYSAYGHIASLPRVVEATTGASIVMTRLPGKRHVDLVNNGLATEDNELISESYGRCASAFFIEGMASAFVIPPEIPEWDLHSIAARARTAIHQNRAYDTPYLESSLLGMESTSVDDAYWRSIALTKSDWSSANFLVDELNVSCIYDFDTAYGSTRIGLLGNIINSCLHLSRTHVRNGLSAAGVCIPPLSWQVAAAHASMWHKALPPLGNRIEWLDPGLLEQKLRDLSHKCNVAEQADPADGRH